jgi:hypothetical protein
LHVAAVKDRILTRTACQDLTVSRAHHLDVPFVVSIMDPNSLNSHPSTTAQAKTVSFGNVECLSSVLTRSLSSWLRAPCRSPSTADLTLPSSQCLYGQGFCNGQRTRLRCPILAYHGYAWRTLTGTARRLFFVSISRTSGNLILMQQSDCVPLLQKLFERETTLLDLCNAGVACGGRERPSSTQQQCW